MIRYENDVIEYLRLPSVPKKNWDGRSSFKDGVAVVKMLDGSEAYAVATFDEERDAKPNIKKVFSIEPFSDITAIYVVPSYMDNDVESFDVDDESKAAAQRLVEEAKALEEVNETVVDESANGNEYYFDTIHNDEEARAFIKAHMKRNKQKGRVPEDHEAILMRLGVIYSNVNRKKVK